MMETNFHVRTHDSRLSPEEFRRLPRRPITVILDNLRSAFNVGSIVRTADCARIEKAIFCGITAHPPNPKIIKTAMGALDYIDWEYIPTTAAAVEKVRAAGMKIICLEVTDVSRPYQDVVYPNPVCLVVGNEALGVSREVLEKADEIVEIPRWGFKNSVNVAVAFGIVVFEAVRQYLDSGS
jgi:23S rRNA (guanosine2251-2'-O)-methyltransferase